MMSAAVVFLCLTQPELLLITRLKNNNLDPKTSKIDVLIIGGGLAGLTSAIHLSRFNFKVLLIEKNSYPKHKVCGEYISNEVLPYLKVLGFDPFEFGAKRISNFELTTHNNKIIRAKLPLGGFGMSRHQMDFQLYQLAINNGVEALQDTVVDVNFEEDNFCIKTKLNQQFHSKIVTVSYTHLTLPTKA